MFVPAVLKTGITKWCIAAERQWKLPLQLHGFSPQRTSTVIRWMRQRKNAQSNVAFENGRNSSSATATSIELPCLLNTGAIASYNLTHTYCSFRVANSVRRSVPGPGKMQCMPG